MSMPMPFVGQGQKAPLRTVLHSRWESQPPGRSFLVLVLDCGHATSHRRQTRRPPKKKRCYKCLGLRV